MFEKSDPGLFAKVTSTLGTLSNFVHTRGHENSSWALNPETNRLAFDQASFEKWGELRTQVVQLVLTFHLLKYPNGLQTTPFVQKMGLNSPIAGVVEPPIRDAFAAYLSPGERAILQQLSDNDEDAQRTVSALRTLPDLSVDEQRKQMHDHDNMLIALGGYESWKKIHDTATPHYNGEGELAARAKYAESKRVWAEQRGLLTLNDARARQRSEAR